MCIRDRSKTASPWLPSFGVSESSVHEDDVARNRACIRHGAIEIDTGCDARAMQIQTIPSDARIRIAGAAVERNRDTMPGDVEDLEPDRRRRRDPEAHALWGRGERLHAEDDCWRAGREVRGIRDLRAAALDDDDI